MAARGRGLFSLYIYIENLKNFLVRNHWTDFHISLQKNSFGNPLPRLFKPSGFVKKQGRQGAGLIVPIYLFRKLKKSSCQKPLDRFPYNFAEMFLWWSASKIVQAIWIRQKTWLPGGGACFSLYIYIENLKNLLVRNHWTDFNIILQKCSFGDPLPRLFKPFGFVKKNMASRGRGLFSLYIYIENLKNLLVRNHWTDFNIILQKCSFGDPLPRLFKLFGFVKKNMAARGRGLFSQYIYIENLKNILVRNHWTDFHIILQKYSFGNPLPRLFMPSGFVKKHGRQGAGLIFPIYLFRKLKKPSCQKPLDRFPYNFAEMFLWWSASKIVQAIWIRQKTWLPGGGACFSLYIYIENL